MTNNIPYSFLCIMVLTCAMIVVALVFVSILQKKCLCGPITFMLVIMLVCTSIIVINNMVATSKQNNHPTHDSEIVCSFAGGKSE